MARALILVEGQTEETFVRDVLAPHLGERDVHVRATLLVTKRVKSGIHFKGGVTRYERIESDVRRLLGDSDAALVTTMLDYYGLPSDFPGQATKPTGDCYARVAHLEQEFKRTIGHPRFDPYLSLHEFEVIAFVEPARAAWVLASRPDAVAALEDVTRRFGDPERINEGVATAPSKRILSVFPRYQKTLHGPQIAGAVGLELIRARCRHFDAWLRRLEGLCGPPASSSSTG